MVDMVNGIPAEQDVPSAGESAAQPEQNIRPDVAFDGTGVALSGGGVRAALFSLGVLIGLVDCGENRKVSHISSVSGGSIVNAAVAQSSKYMDCTSVEEFEEVAKPLAYALSRRGAFVFSRAAVWESVRYLGPRFVGFVTAAVIPVAISANAVPDVGAWPWRWIGLVAVAVILVGISLTRGWLQEALYGATLASVARRGAGKRMLTDLTDSPTTHVLIATDLVSGSPVYFSRDFVCCPAFGWGDSARVRTSSAVYASAAFPIVFPTRRFRRRRFRFQNGYLAPPFPHWLKLTDGGVHNNLATGWYDELSRQTGMMWAFGNMPLPRPLDQVRRRVVVNAGGGSRAVRRVPPVLSAFRVMSVLYDNTVRPRLDALMDRSKSEADAPIVIDIRESPYHLARRHSDWDIEELGDRETAEARRDRAEDLVRWLGRQPEEYWYAFARQTSGTPTKLTKAGMESGARMMLHGYLSTLVVLNIVDDVKIPDVVRDEGYFLDLAGRAPRDRAALQEALQEAVQPEQA
jgi:predicted acylesterase/phospholipase RssA